MGLYLFWIIIAVRVTGEMKGKTQEMIEEGKERVIEKGEEKVMEEGAKQRMKGSGAKAPEMP